MGDVDPNKDYGEIQCLNNSNFHNNIWCNFMYSLMGGINYHYEHHLFPTMSHSHYPSIAPIVKQTCKDFNYPYLEFDSIIEVSKSFLEKYGRLVYKGR